MPGKALVIDANILVRAVLGRRVREIIQMYGEQASFFIPDCRLCRSDNVIPSWSRDGSSIYFASKRSGRQEIWRIPAGEGTAIQVTRQGGFVAFESTDGTTLYYTLSEGGAEGLYAKRLPDGEEKQVLKDGVAQRGFAVFSDGVYYLHRLGLSSYEIRFFEFAGVQPRVVGEIEGTLANGLAVSPDRKTFLFPKFSDAGTDLMLIENFR